MTLQTQPISKQDLLIRMSIDPKWSPDIPDGPFQQAVRELGDERLLDVKMTALKAERIGRWLQIFGGIESILKHTLNRLSATGGEFIESDLFQAFLSSEFLWDPQYSLPHPAGYGRGIEKATPFICFLRTVSGLDQELLELAELEYATFRSAYLLPNTPHTGELTTRLFLSQASSLLAVSHDVLAILENNEVAVIPKWYAIAPGGRSFRISSEIYHYLLKFVDGHTMQDNAWEAQVVKMAVSLGLLCNDLGQFEHERVQRLVKQ
ncbi:hypothetical protein [Tumebacillus lipolyticus]|uniref:Uncharacterized protein n=1 Tax=Tumebacillus lipolyticus TaxID=1280370 RepID=A0ABW4ZX71_9BACL